MFKKTAIRSAEGAKEIIEDNLQVIYHLPNKYEYTHKLLMPVRRDLLKVLNFAKKVDPIIWHQKYVWFVDNTSLTYKIRKRTTASTSSRHFNFLCCIGLIRKVKQNEAEMIGINREFLLETGKPRPMNVITVHRYTKKELEKIESRAKLLYEKKVTAGNISRDKLVASGLENLASEVYFANTDKALQSKKIQWQQVVKVMEQRCDEQGFTTKAEICRYLDLSKDSLNELMKVFKLQFAADFEYKSSKKEQRERLGITSPHWIITRRANNEKKSKL